MIVITAPTGQIGSQVVDRLLPTGEPLRVVARDPQRLSPQVRDRVEVVAGTHGDPAVVDAAFAGADAVFWLVAADPQAPSIEAAYVDFSRPAVEAFARHGVTHVVGVSALGRGTPVADHAGHVTATLALDDLIASSGVAYRALANPGFMDNILRSVPTITGQGTIYGISQPDLAAPAAATRDIAAVAAGLLADRSWSGVAEVPVLGPEDLSFDDMVGVISEVLGRPVTYTRILAETLRTQLRGYGFGEPVIQAMIDMMDAKDHGLDGGVTRTPENSTPTSFRQWCQEVLVPAVGAAA